MDHSPFMAAALDAFTAAQEAFYTASEDHARAGVYEVSRRFPARVVRYYAGNGTSVLLVGKRGETAPELYTGAWHANPHYGNWPARVALPSFLQELDALEDETRLPGLGACEPLTLKNGEPFAAAEALEA